MNGPFLSREDMLEHRVNEVTRQRNALYVAIKNLDAIGMEEGIENIPFPYKVRFREGWAEVMAAFELCKE